jgi:hypothetical protein
MSGADMDYLLGAEATLLAAFLWWRQGILHPATMFSAVWMATFAFRVTAPMSQAEMTPTAAWVIGLGLLAVCVPGAVSGRPRPVTHGVRLGDRDVALRRLIVLTCAVAAVVFLALYIFRSYISGYYGADLGQLSSSAIRAAQLAGTRGGPLTLGLALSPLLAALGVYGALRYSRWWLLVTALALFATLQYPARITTLSLAVSCAAFSAYARPAVRQDPAAPASRGRRSTAALVLQLLVVACAALAYFVYTSIQLRNDVVAAFYVRDWTWPDWMLSPVQYLVGGVAGLTAATALPDGDPYGPDGHPVTVYLPLLVSGQNPPDTIAGFTPAPFPVNVYTAFGDLFFDFGIGGVIALSLVLGLVVQATYRQHHRRLEWAWVTAVLVNVLLSTGLAYRLFYLDVAVMAVAGWAAFGWLSRSAPPAEAPAFPWTHDRGQAKGPPGPKGSSFIDSTGVGGERL